MDKLNLKNPQVISYLDDSKEELVARLLRVQAQLKIERAQSEWLDLLANELRDCANKSYHEDWMDEMREEQETAYKEYREVRKYQDQKLEEYFVKD